MTTISIISDASSTCSHVSECGVCYEAYNDSDRRRTSLTCQHAFCRTCVEHQCAGTSRLKCPLCQHVKRLTCPLCRRLVDVPSLSQPPTTGPTRLVNEVVSVETTSPSGMDGGHPDGDIQHREGAQIEDGKLDKIKQKRRGQPTENERASSDRASVSSLETQSEPCCNIPAFFYNGPDEARWTWQMAWLLVLIAIPYHIVCICVGCIQFYAPYIDSVTRTVGAVRYRYGIAGLFLCLDQIAYFKNVLVHLPIWIFLFYSYVPTSVFYSNLYHRNDTSNVTFNLSDPQSCAPMRLPFVIWMDCGFLLVVCLLHQGGLYYLLRKVISSELPVAMKWFVCVDFGLVCNTLVPAVFWAVNYVPCAAGLPFTSWLSTITDINTDIFYGVFCGISVCVDFVGMSLKYWHIDFAFPGGLSRFIIILLYLSNTNNYLVAGISPAATDHDTVKMAPPPTETYPHIALSSNQNFVL